MSKQPLKISTARALTRREFMWLSSMAAAGTLFGCATDPVTGKKQLMLVSEDTEIQIDKQYSPMQISSDFGAAQDSQLNSYVSQVGTKMAAKSHRTHMPYSFRVVNATYVNAYAFPGGTIAATRGIMLSLANEAELASLLGHELGHVNARHSAEQMSKGMLTNAVVGGVSVLAGTQSAVLGDLAGQLGQISAGALLASYSRDNEREADALGMKYMVGAGYGSEGFVGLMDMLNSMSKHKSTSVDLLFATHPMSQERHDTAVQMANTQYRSALNGPLYRERYMDNTARLRAQKGAVEEIEKGQSQLAKRQYDAASAHFQRALKQAPNDYVALCMMSKTKLIQEQYAAGRQYAEMAQKAYPQEAQAYHLSGFSKIQLKDFEGAYEEFDTYDRLMPGNPNIIFFKGYSLEGMANTQQAAQHYQRFLQVVQQGQYAQHAYRRLVDWGYIK
ncbi:MAG: M48 family metalloprotease [Deltaproteobacteria bacterium]|jgi:predicted Zn-dependent protease|nr:M48 family metalloprotease [Deltaproteobacteria bacterium]